MPEQFVSVVTKLEKRVEARRWLLEEALHALQHFGINEELQEEIRKELGIPK